MTRMPFLARVKERPRIEAIGIAAQLQARRTTLYLLVISARCCVGGLRGCHCASIPRRVDPHGVRGLASAAQVFKVQGATKRSMFHISWAVFGFHVRAARCSGRPGP